MSDKTLVERLREVDLGCDQHTDCQLANVVGVGCTSATCAQCGMDTAHALADAIEREYLPRPRFEDGDPVQFGDKYTTDSGKVGTVFRIEYTESQTNIWPIEGDNIGIAALVGDERVKRLKPEVLDADGVPIRVGDHVWFKQGTHYDGVEYVVTEVTKTQVHYKNSESEYPRGGCPHYCASSNLTHKQPDSLERIEADARKNPYDYWGCGGKSCLNCPAKKDGKEPRERYGTHSCNQAMKLDLLRRQREVLERDHER